MNKLLQNPLRRVKRTNQEAELVDPQSDAGDDGMQIDEEEQAEEIQEQGAVAPPVLKPLLVKRRLIMGKGPMTEKPKPTRVSQRCLGKWSANKAKTNTAENPVEIESEGDQATPKKAEGEPAQPTDQEDTRVSPESGGANESEKADTSVHGETAAADQDESLLQAEEEARYQVERKLKGKAIVKRKPSTKKPRAVNTGIVITETARRTPSSRQEQSDSEYEISEESESDSDESMKEEEYREEQLPHDHCELVHPPAEKLRYK